jgi:helix-turn-helix protein
VSIQAVAWALEQDFTYQTPKGRLSCCHAAKLVLISLANHADHVSGHCWPSGETIAREASCTLRSVYRLVAALARNGFIDIKRSRGMDGKQRSNNYWILFDRKPAPWQYYPDDDPNDHDDPGDSESPGEAELPHDSESSGHAVENSPVSTAEKCFESPGPSDIRVTRHNELEPSGLEPSVASNVENSAPPAFDPKQRTQQVAKLLAAEQARKPKFVPVIEGSEAWKSWIKHGHKSGLTTWVEFNGKRHRGWYFESYFPPKSTGPPLDSLAASIDDLSPLAKEMNR